MSLYGLKMRAIRTDYIFNKIRFLYYCFEDRIYSVKEEP